MASPKHKVRFPGESPAYRAARDKLLDAEIELRRATEAVAMQRRKLPLGGELPQDYVFEEIVGDSGKGTKKKVRMSELFAPGKDSLILYNFMYGPDVKRPCPSCTSIIDGLDGEAQHVGQRVNLAIVAKSPIERIREFAKERGWRHLRILSSANSTYNHDYQGENAKGEQMPAMNVFVKRNGKMYHSWNTELMFAPSDPGQDMRHVDMIWPLWSLLDVTPDGRGEKWNPKLAY
ncbi:MAG: DUF899 domain-containing protein [Gemmatimonadetes bacterium]|nr:MAG: DUF899 domain-containing protein [Gemmatimonadota bacterium]